MPRNKPILDEVATVEKDIDLFSGWLGRLENPDTVLRYESGGQGVRIYEELERDWQVYTCLQTRALALQACEWQVEPATDKRQDVKIADFVRKVLESANFDRFCRDLMQGVLTGYKPAEVMWEISEGDVWVKEFRGKRPSRFVFDLQYNLRLLTPTDMVVGEQVPDRKFVVWSVGGFDHNPYGQGLGYQSYWPVWFKKNGVKFWVVFCEKFASPTAIGKYPPGTGNDEKDTLLEAIRAIQQETGIRIPDTMAIELLEAQRTGAITYQDACNYFDRAISKVWLGQTLTTEPGDSGSYSLGKVHDEVRGDILKADADHQCEAINNSLIRWIVDYNFPDVKKSGYPKVWRRTEPEEDLKPLAERDKIILVDMGLGKRVPESYLSETYNIPLAKEGEPVISPPEPVPVEGDEPIPVEFAEFKKNEFGQGDVDTMTDIALVKASDEMEEMLKPVMEMIENAGSLEEVAEKIYGLYPKMDSSKLRDLLARAMNATGLVGFAASEKDRS